MYTENSDGHTKIATGHIKKGSGYIRTENGHILDTFVLYVLIMKT